MNEAGIVLGIILTLLVFSGIGLISCLIYTSFRRAGEILTEAQQRRAGEILTEAQQTLAAMSDAVEKAEEKPEYTRFRRQPVCVDAIQFTDDMRDNLPEGVELVPWDDDGDQPSVFVDRGYQVRLWNGDWIVKHPAGTYSVVDPDIFSVLYSPAD